MKVVRKGSWVAINVPNGTICKEDLYHGVMRFTTFYQKRVLLQATWHSCTALIYACNVEVLNLVLIVKVKNIGR